MTIQTIRIATRKSKLALWQAEFIKAQLLAAHPELTVELVGMTTSGDKWLSTPLSEIGGKGLFIKELEAALLDGRAEIAVHSMKDVPAELAAEFVFPAIGYRTEVRDVLVSTRAASVVELPLGARVGSSSLRRKAQLKVRRRDLSIAPIRGNVNTRLDKLDAGEFDALLLAGVGLQRLGLESRIREYLSLEDSLPAAGQGALGVECLTQRQDLVALLSVLNDPITARCVGAERAVSRSLGADCSLPIAAYAQQRGDSLELAALLASADGERIVRTSVVGRDAQVLGETAAEALRQLGADEILRGLREG